MQVVAATTEFRLVPWLFVTRVHNRAFQKPVNYRIRLDSLKDSGPTGIIDRARNFVRGYYSWLGGAPSLPLQSVVGTAQKLRLWRCAGR